MEPKSPYQLELEMYLSKGINFEEGDKSNIMDACISAGFKEYRSLLIIVATSKKFPEVAWNSLRFYCKEADFDFKMLPEAKYFAMASRLLGLPPAPCDLDRIYNEILRICNNEEIKDSGENVNDNHQGENEDGEYSGENKESGQDKNQIIIAKIIRGSTELKAVCGTSQLLYTLCTFLKFEASLKVVSSSPITKEMILASLFVKYPDLESLVKMATNPEALQEVIERERYFNETDLLLHGFKVPYINVFQPVEFIVNYLTLLANSPLDNWYAYSCALVQSSGMGKSRTMLQVARKIPSVYVCQRDERDTGFPKRTPDIVSRLLHIPNLEMLTVKVNGKETNLDYSGAPDVYIQLRCIGFFQTLIKTTYQFFFEKRRSGVEFAVACQQYLDLQRDEQYWQNVFDAIPDAEILLLLGNVKASFTADHSWQSIEGTLVNMFSRELPSLSDLYDAPFNFLFIIDEARRFNDVHDLCHWSLLSHLNRASRCFQRRGFVFLFMDTLSDINILSTSTFFDSHRGAIAGVKQCVLTDIPTTDCFYIKRIYDFKTIWDTYVDAAMTIFGRPLWGALFASGESPDSSIIIANAETKLMLTIEKLLIKFNVPDLEREELRAMAVIASRVNLDIVPKPVLVNRLVSSFLATLVYYDSEKRFGSISYPSDPILSIACSTYCKRKWEDLLKHLWASVGNDSIVNDGSLGELVMQILLIMAVDSLHDKKEAGSNEVFPTMKVQHFLKAFVGENLLDSLAQVIAKREEVDMLNLLDARINFNHFIEVADYTPNRSDMIYFVHRRAAIVCKKNQSDFDLIIPVVLRHPHGSKKTPKSQIDPREMKTSFQIKNSAWKVARPTNSITSNLSNPKVNLLTLNTTAETVKKSSSDLLQNSGAVQSADEILVGNIHRERATLLSTGQYSENEYALDADNISYLLIQCKNFNTMEYKFKGLNVVNSGIEIETDDERPHAVILAMFIENKRSQSINKTAYGTKVFDLEKIRSTLNACLYVKKNPGAKRRATKEVVDDKELEDDLHTMMEPSGEELEDDLHSITESNDDAGVNSTTLSSNQIPGHILPFGIVNPHQCLTNPAISSTLNSILGKVPTIKYGQAGETEMNRVSYEARKHAFPLVFSSRKLN